MSKIFQICEAVSIFVSDMILSTVNSVEPHLNSTTYSYVSIGADQVHPIICWLHPTRQYAIRGYFAETIFRNIMDTSPCLGEQSKYQDKIQLRVSEKRLN